MLYRRGSYRGGFDRTGLTFVIVAALGGCAPQGPVGNATEEASAAQAAQVIEVGRPDQILRLQSFPAKRTTVVKGGGYFPVIARLDNGDIVAVIRGGGAHMGRGGRLDLVFSSDDGETWSAPQTAVEGPDDYRNRPLAWRRTAPWCWPTSSRGDMARRASGSRS